MSVQSSQEAGRKRCEALNLHNSALIRPLLRRAFTDFSDFLGRLLVIVEFYSHDYLFTWLHVFFSDDVLQRNYLIKRVALVEEKSILVFPECLEASE